MKAALVLMDRCMNGLREMRSSGDVSELQKIINELDVAGDILVHRMAKRGCLGCPPQGKVLNESN
jgi:hypothetical protein